MGITTYSGISESSFSLADATAAATAALGQNQYLFFQGAAEQQVVGDPSFLDLTSNLRNGAFGANLSNVAAWANPGFVSTVDPTGGATDSVIRLPNLNYDYSGGEKLIFYWLGKATPEGSNVDLIGDGSANTTGFHGIDFRMTTAGKIQPILLGATSGFGGSSATTVFDGTLHSFGVVFDGVAKKYGIWCDEALEPAFGSNYLTFNSGTDVDTKNANTFNIGQVQPAASASTQGAATQTRCMVIMRTPSTVTTPTVGQITQIFKQLRANQNKLVTGNAF